ncbi:hypothetical protein RCO48_37185 [Peribacillus frigoritolerans]|nr:hypothetical protein [Peribacillus frigoritolerans]
MDVKSSYEEALYTLKMKNIFPDDMALILHYEELGMFQMIESLASNKQRRVHPSILKLKAYDMKKPDGIAANTHRLSRERLQPK